MKQFIVSLLRVFPEISRKKLLLFAVIFLIKLFTCLYISYLVKCSDPSSVDTLLAQKSGDAPSYLDPIDNFISEGDFYLRGSNDEKIFIGRAPYYGSFYFLFRLFFSQLKAYDAMAFLQIALESISIIYLALLAFKLTGSRKVSRLTCILMLLSMNCTFYSIQLQTESLSVSFLIIFSYYYYDYLKDKRKSSLVITGIFLGACVCLKTYFALLYIPIGIGLLIEKSFDPLRILKNILLILFPLVLIVAPYSYRNFSRFGKIQPFQYYTAGYNYSKADFAFRKFVQAWGGSFIHWDKRSAGCYFIPKPELRCEFTFPEYAFCEAYSMKDIERVRNIYIQYQQTHSKTLEDSVSNSFDRLTLLYKSHRPFRYYVLTPLIFVKEFLVNSGSYYLPIRADFPCYKKYQLLIKYSQSLLYWLSLILGAVGLIILWKLESKAYIVCFIPLYLVTLFAVVLRATEFRYFVNAYPFLVLGMAVLTGRITNAIQKSTSGVKT